jgi:hypothetical protein
MAREDEVTCDQLSDRHELWRYDPTNPESTQVVSVEHGGEALEVIVPLYFDGLRVGEVVAAAVVGRIALLLCRHDRPLDGYDGVPGLLVVALPHPDGRHRSVIAHATFALEKPGLGPMFRAGPEAGAAADPTGPGRERPGPIAEALLRARRAEPFVRFRLRLADGGPSRSRVPRPWPGTAGRAPPSSSARGRTSRSST